MVAAADGKVVVARLDDFGVTNGGDSSPRGRIGRREEVPVAEHVACTCVADIVGGHGEPVDTQANLAVVQLVGRFDVHLGVADRRLADLQDMVGFSHTPQHG